MKISVVVSLWFLVSAQAFAVCAPISRTFHVFAQPFGGNLAGSYGVTRVQLKSETAAACVYQLQSRVNEYANPLKTGAQTLVVSKVQGNLGHAFSLLDSNSAVTSTGTFFNSPTQVTLSIPLTGCGGQGGGNNCGIDVILQ